jgi:hypothetical protein
LSDAQCGHDIILIRILEKNSKNITLFKLLRLTDVKELLCGKYTFRKFCVIHTAVDVLVISALQEIFHNFQRSVYGKLDY